MICFGINLFVLMQNDPVDLSRESRSSVSRLDIDIQVSSENTLPLLQAVLKTQSAARLGLHAPAKSAWARQMALAGLVVAA